VAEGFEFMPFSLVGAKLAVGGTELAMEITGLMMVRVRSGE
jgi:hypothetical protein